MVGPSKSRGGSLDACGVVKSVLFASNIWQREIFVGLAEGNWDPETIPQDIKEEVMASHDAPFTTKDAEDLMNVERANMHHGSLHLGQPAIHHRAINSNVLPDSDKQQLIAGPEDYVTLKENRTVPKEVHWAGQLNPEYSLGKEHLRAILEKRERELYPSPGAEAYTRTPYAVEALYQHGESMAAAEQLQHVWQCQFFVEGSIVLHDDVDDTGKEYFLVVGVNEFGVLLHQVDLVKFVLRGPLVEGYEEDVDDAINLYIPRRDMVHNPEFQALHSLENWFVLPHMVVCPEELARRNLERTLQLGCKVYFYLANTVQTDNVFGESLPLTVLQYSATTGFGKVSGPNLLKMLRLLRAKLNMPELLTKDEPALIEDIIRALLKLIFPKCSEADMEKAVQARGVKNISKVISAVDENDAGDLAEALESVLDQTDAAELGAEIEKRRKRREKAARGDPASSDEEADPPFGANPPSEDEDGDPNWMDRVLRDVAREEPVRRAPVTGPLRKPPTAANPLPEGMLNADHVRQYHLGCATTLSYFSCLLYTSPSPRD